MGAHQGSFAEADVYWSIDTLDKFDSVFGRDGEGNNEINYKTSTEI